MRTKGLVFSAVVALTLIATACASTPQAHIPSEYVNRYLPDTSGVDQPDVEMAVPFPETAGKTPAYRIKYPDVTTRYATDMAERFGVSGEILEGDQQFTVVDSSTGNTVEVFKTGAVYFEATNDYVDVLFNDSAELPSLQESIDIAVKYLEEKGLLPAEVKGYAKAGIGGGTTARHGTHILVSFKYQIGSYQVEGPGFRYYVRVGDKGRVGEAFVFKPEVESYSEVELRTPREAFSDLTAGNCSWMDVRGKTAVIDKVSLRYYLLPVIDSQEYVLPVFVFEGSAKMADGSISGRVGALVTAVTTQLGQPIQ